MATKKVPSKKTAKPKKVVAKKPVESKQGAYHLSITLNEQEFTAKADSIFDALIQFKAPPFIKTEATIKVSAGKLKSEAVIGVFGARRTFQNQTALKLLASNLEKRLG